jgi:hypothetical protein
MKRTHRLGMMVLAVFVLVAGSAEAQTTANGPYSPTRCGCCQTRVCLIAGSVAGPIREPRAAITALTVEEVHALAVVTGQL